MELDRHLFRSQAPILERLSVEDCTLPWNSTLYQYLSSLNIKLQDTTLPFTISSMFEKLRSVGDRLHHLGLVFPVVRQLSDLGETPLLLPKLNSLVLGRRENEAAQLLPFLRIPS